MNPVRAEIVGNSENPRVGHAAPADVIGRFQHHIAAAGGRKPARGGDPRRAGADNHDIDHR